MVAIEKTEELAAKARRIRRHIIAMVTAAAEASDILSQEGTDCRLLNMATLRPMDSEAIVQEVKAVIERKGSQRYV